MMEIAETTKGSQSKRAVFRLATKDQRPALWCVIRVAAALICFTATSLASAETRRGIETGTPSVEDDSEWIQAGIAAYKKRDYAAARDSLIRAWEHSHLGTVAGILAESEMKLQRYADAAEHWTEYLRLLPEESKTERDEAIRQIAICREHVGLVIVDVNSTRAVIIVDGAEVLSQRQALHQLWLPLGKHVIQARANGQVSPAKTITLESGNDQRVDLAVPVAPPPTTVQARVVGPLATKAFAIEPRSETSSGPSMRTIVLITESALTVAALGIGIGAWFSYRSADRDATELLTQVDSGNKDPTYAQAPCEPSNPSRPGACDGLAERVRDRADAAEIVNVAMPVAGILAASTVGTFFLWPRSEQTPSGAQETLTVTPHFSPTTRGLTAQMRF